MQERPRLRMTNSMCEVSQFALHTLDVLALTMRRDAENSLRHPIDDFVNRMGDAVLSADRFAVDAVVRHMRSAEIATPTIAEIYVPAVARLLGEGWCADTLDFSAVTVGSARLQGLIRRLGPAWDQPSGEPVGIDTSVLVAVPYDCQHTLGATILAGHMRRRGYMVQLELGVTPAQLAQLAGSGNHAAIMISASAREPLETLRTIVQGARQESPNTPIIIGGTALAQETDYQAGTGADLATSDIGEALRFCGPPGRTATPSRLQRAG